MAIGNAIHTGELTQSNANEGSATISELYKNDPLMFDEAAGTINIGSQESDPRAQLLSNFAHTPFVLDSVRYACVEAFIQALKSSDLQEQERISTLVGREAKKVGKQFSSDIKDAHTIHEDEGSTEPVGYVTNYQGILIPFRSEEHYALIERALRAKFDQNPQALEALVGENYSERARLTHILARSDGSVIEESPTTSLPAEVFTSILMRIRQEKQTDFLVGRPAVLFA